MKTLAEYRNENGRIIAKSLNQTLLLVLFFAWLPACNKDAVQPANEQVSAVEAAQIRLSVSQVSLIQENAGTIALTISWKEKADPNTIYTVETALSGTFFETPIELVSTQQNHAAFSTGYLNEQLCKILYGNNTAMVEFRVKAQRPFFKEAPEYYQPTSLRVSTYQLYTAFDKDDFFRIPGNYQNWTMSTAPKIVSEQHNGLYEGYINFASPLIDFQKSYPQVVMVKGDKCVATNVFNDLGNGKYGTYGSVMPIREGPGIYLFRANENNQRWYTVKINSFGLTGTAIGSRISFKGSDLEMVCNQEELSWSICTNLVKGSFRFRANNKDDLSFGYDSQDITGKPSYLGKDIVINKEGNYTIKLLLKLAGNYAFSIQKN